MPRKWKTIALGAGVAALLMGAPPALAAEEKTEYKYDGANTSGSYSGDTSPGSGGAGEYVDKANPANESGWIAERSFLGSGKRGVLRMGSGSRLIIDYDGNEAPDFAFGGLAGYESPDDIIGNEVHYNGGDSSAKILIGGVSYFGSAKGNLVHYYGGGLAGFNVGNSGVIYAVIGGAAMGDGDASVGADGNIVHIEGSGNITGHIYGGAVISPTSEDEASNNAVTIENYSGTITGSVYGGGAHEGHAKGNYVKISKGSGSGVTITGAVVGGAINVLLSTADGEASGNRVSLEDVAVGNDVIGNYSSAGLVDGQNLLSVSIAGGSVYGGLSYNDHDLAVKNNRVSLAGGAAISGDVYGGRVNAGGSGATYNEVEISGAASVYGDVYGGQALDAGDALENIVRIDNSGQINKTVFGGDSREGDAISNHVIIKNTDGKIGRDVYGGSTGVSGTTSGGAASK